MKNFGNILKELRIEKELSQTQLADILHVKHNTVSSWERGVNEPSQDIMIKLTEIFDVSMDYLFGLEK